MYVCMYQGKVESFNLKTSLTFIYIGNGVTIALGLWLGNLNAQYDFFKIIKFLK